MFVSNFKGIYDTFECDACGKFEEDQEHILKCQILKNMNKEYEEIPEYEKLFIGSVKDQLIIAKVFKENMKILESIKDKK